MKSFSGIGVMTGTSLDGVDLVCATFEESKGRWNYSIQKAACVSMDEKWHDRLFCLAESDAETYAKTNVYFGHYLGKIIRDFIDEFNLKPDFVACHGQTIFHQPEKNFTAQIGDGETIVSYLDCPLVTNFRNKDVALGGQGAPLVPFGEKHLFSGFDFFLNLGGIANISKGEIAFDVCPCNLVLNSITMGMNPPRKFDKDGLLAREGSLNSELFQQLEQLEYYKIPAPKSLGVEWIEQNIFPLLDNPGKNELHTIARHIALQIGKSILQLGGSGSLMVTGGGARNVFLMECIQNELQKSQVEIATIDESIIDNKEALIFAFLGLQVMLGKPNTFASVTGASHDNCGGSIHLPAIGYKSLL